MVLLNDLSAEQINKALDRQYSLENTFDLCYNAFSKHQQVSQWWQENLWNYLNLEKIK